MDLAKILSPDAVRVLSGVTSKKRLFQELSHMFEGLKGVPAGFACDALLERENLGPTGVGNGVALPHARLADVESVAGVFVRLETPLDFESVDRQPVDLVFALFAPEEAGAEHLRALASVSRSMRNANTCAKLRANQDPATLFAVLTDKEASKAA